MYQDELQKKEDQQKDRSNSTQSPQAQKLTKEQKIGATVLLIFAFFILIFWAMQFSSSFKGPYERSQEQANKQDAQTTTQPGSAELTDAELRQKDTDGDGLNDWEELNVYKTSPYLEDSDSDGYFDKQEIDSDNDPLCPLGKECNSTAENTIPDTSVNTEGGTTSESSGIDPSALDSKLDSKSRVMLEDLLSGQLNAQKLRAVLIEMGLDANVVNQLSDEELMKSYQESLLTQ